MGKRKPPLGITLDTFLTEEGIRESVRTEAMTRVVAWQLSQEMEKQGISKAKLAELMHTSRAQVDRILNAKGNVTIDTLQRVAGIIGREIRMELVRRGLRSTHVNAPNQAKTARRRVCGGSGRRLNRGRLLVGERRIGFTRSDNVDYATTSRLLE